MTRTRTREWTNNIFKLYKDILVLGCSMRVEQIDEEAVYIHVWGVPGTYLGEYHMLYVLRAQ